MFVVCKCRNSCMIYEAFCDNIRFVRIFLFEGSFREIEYDESLTTERVIVKFTRKEEFPMDFDMLLGVTRLTLNVAGTISYLISIIQKVVTLSHQQKEDSSTPSK